MPRGVVVRSRVSSCLKINLEIFFFNVEICLLQKLCFFCCKILRLHLENDHQREDSQILRSFKMKRRWEYKTAFILSIGGKFVFCEKIILIWKNYFGFGQSQNRNKGPGIGFGQNRYQYWRSGLGIGIGFTKINEIAHAQFIRLPNFDSLKMKKWRKKISRWTIGRR